MAATRTQIYLTQEQRERIEELRARDGRSLAEVIRTALDEYLESHGREAAARELADKRQALDETFGSAPDFPYPDRGDWDRGYG
jgi:Arc/MetJ-type ribon-helix-helix transcriptional regulator